MFCCFEYLCFVVLGVFVFCSHGGMCVLQSWMYVCFVAMTVFVFCSMCGVFTDPGNATPWDREPLCQAFPQGAQMVPLMMMIYML